MSKYNKEAIKEIRKLGFTYQAISDIFGIHPSAIRRLIDEKSGEKYRKYNKERSRDYYSKEENRLSAKEQRRQSVLMINGKYTKVNKRPRPDNICEVCGTTRNKLDYHHWNDDKPNHGIWLCHWCHIMAEGVDKGSYHKYIELKDKISKGEH